MKPRRTLQDMLKGLSRSFNCATPSAGERHVFQEKALRKKRLCAGCNEPVLTQGSVCRVCKIISHKKCEGKVTSGCSSPPPPDMRRRTAPGPSIQHMGSTKSINLKQRSSLPRSFSLDHVIQRSYDLDLTYITERIISVFFPTSVEEKRYHNNLREVASMLRSKHEDKYLLFNLSRKRHDITRLNPKVQDFFWPDCHAPALDVICSICKAMEAWLNSDPQHVVVLHCQGNQGKTGVVIASYMHYSKVSASVDQALSTLAMRKFCEDKVSVSLHPSQRRYINYFGGLLSGNIKISSDMLSLQCVLLPVIPALQTEGGFCPFLKIYQSMQLVYTSGIYFSLGDATNQRRQLCINLEPALLLKGDIMVKCYHKRRQPHEREVVFRLQFHTCTIHNSHLCFSKDQLDCACTDDRFPESATVEFIFGNEKTKGREGFRNDPAVSVDYDITDPLVRFDSYENLNTHHEDSLEDLSHTRGPLDGSLYARVKKKSTPLASNNGSPEHHGRLLSVSSDSGHSSAPTERLEETPQKPLPTPAEREDLERLLGGFGVAVKQDGESQYSQVMKNDEVGMQNGNQRNKMNEKPQDLQHIGFREGANQNIQTKINGDVRPLYPSGWPGAGDDGTSQNLPLMSSSWEGQREVPCENQWGNQRDREIAIMEEELGQFGGLAVFQERRPVLSRHCSCRLGYAPGNIEGPPSRSYFRTEGILEPRGAPGPAAVLQAAHYPGIYSEQDRRRLYRSLSEGPQHYPTQTQSPPKRGSLRDTRPYLCQGPPSEPVLFPLCPCSHCQSSVCYPAPNIWPLEEAKIPPMQPFHRGEHQLHLNPPYNRGVQLNNDIPPFQMPQSKMHYGYPTPHGEDTLNFNQFTEGGYGHNYPNFLHPTYLPTHCAPSGYGSPSFPSCLSPYNPPEDQAPHSSSVSPIIPSNPAPRRLSDEAVSVDSTSVPTSVHQPHEERGNSASQKELASSRPQLNQEAVPAVGTTGLIQTKSAFNVQSSVHTNPPGPGQTSSSMHAQIPVQTDGFMYPQSHVHTSTPINTNSQSSQTHSQTSVPTKNPYSPDNSLGQICSTQRPSLQTAEVQNQSAQHSPDRTHNTHVCVHSPLHTKCPPAQPIKLHTVRFQNPEHTENTAVQIQNNVRRCEQAEKNENNMHAQSSNAQSHSPVYTQGSHVHPQSSVYVQSSPCHPHSPAHIQCLPVQHNSLGHTQSSPPHMQGLLVQHNSLGHTQSSPVHSHSSGHAQSPSTRSHSPGYTQGPPAPHYSSGYTQCPPGHLHSTEDMRNPPAHLHSPGQMQIPQVHTPSPPLNPHSPGHAQGPPSHPPSPGHSQSPPAHIHSLGHVQSQPTYLHSSGNMQSPPPPLNIQPSVHLQEAPSHQMSMQSIPTHTQSPSAQANSPQETQTSSPLQSSVCKDNPHEKINSTVHTQKDNTTQTTITVHTQMPSTQPHVSVQKVSPQVQMQNTVRIQSASMQTFRNAGNQGPPVQNQKPGNTHHPQAERPGLSLSCVDVSTTVPGISCASSTPHVSKVAPQLPSTPRTKSLEATRGQFSFGPIFTSNEGIVPPTEFGGSYPSLITPAPNNGLTPPKRSHTVSLPMTHGSCHGGSTPTSPPLTPVGSQCDLLPPSPTPSFPISTAYYSGSPCPPKMQQPPCLPEKNNPASGGAKSESVRQPNGHLESRSSASSADIQQETPLMAGFVQDSSKFWYKPNISREQAIAILRCAEPGSFLIRDSNSFRGAYGLALKVFSPPPNVVTQPCKDPAEQLVRHFLIETGPKGVKIKGSPIEPHFGSLSALVSQHSVTPLSLPCRLRIPTRDLAEQNSEIMAPTNMSTAADLLRQGAACSVLYLGSVDTESLTGPQAISKASSAILTPPRSTATTVHFKVSEQGITLTDSQRKLFFRRHYPVSSVTFCSADPQDRRWTNPDRTTSKVFGFVARKSGTTAENVCHLFAELDPEQPASAIVNFVTKVMLGTQRR
ncbi:tensin-2 isoform X2 [Pelobates cultripes]|uniref:Tensin-2 isoform X2 n=2 Tax=Pelobates cultripes TaxID=61616 RepID=A0AAD1VRE6_PELCU|nr:tensin-2 isoform X2 [Pelobates cultripes]